MHIRLSEEYMPLSDFKELLDTATNLKDIYLVCYQAGCPVYLVRDVAERVAILWHPCLDPKRDVFHPDVTDGIFTIKTDDGVWPFETLEDLTKTGMAAHLLDDDPFNDEYLVWSKEEVNHE